MEVHVEMPVEDRAAITDLRVAMMRLARRMRQERDGDGLTPSQLAVLATLVRRGPLPPSALAEIERVQPPSMTRILAALERDGWVVRHPHPQDGRQVVIEATEAAHDWVDAERRRRDQWLCQRVEHLSTQEREALLRVAPILERLAGTE